MQTSKNYLTSEELKNMIANLSYSTKVIEGVYAELFERNLISFKKYKELSDQVKDIASKAITGELFKE